jgi:hypothetical protein
MLQDWLLPKRAFHVLITVSQMSFLFASAEAAGDDIQLMRGFQIMESRFGLGREE